MKFTQFSLTILFAVGMFGAHAQPNFLLIDDLGTTWRQSQVCVWNCMEFEDYTYAISGIDSSSGTHYYKIREEMHKTGSGQDPFDPCNDVNMSYINDYRFGLREDSGIVYFYNPVQAAEYPMYDFTAQVGDTVPDAFSLWNGGIGFNAMLFVDSIDTVLVDGVNRTRWFIGPNGNYHVIEGIGGSKGLTFPLYEMLECAHELDCYTEGGASLYPNPGTACNTFIGHLDVNEELSKKELTKVYSADAVQVGLGGSNTSFEYHLYNTSGQLMKKGKTTSAILFRYQDYPTGIYILQLETDNSLYTSKLMLR